MNLKTIAKKGFLSKKVTVEEWDGAVVVLQEPSHKHLSRYFKAINEVNENEYLPQESRENLLIKHEAELFITVFFDENKESVFKENDIDELVENYGPIHTRLLNQAIDLASLGQKPIEDSEKKSMQTQS